MKLLFFLACSADCLLILWLNVWAIWTLAKINRDFGVLESISWNRANLLPIELHSITDRLVYRSRVDKVQPIYRKPIFRAYLYRMSRIDHFKVFYCLRKYHNFFLIILTNNVVVSKDSHFTGSIMISLALSFFLWHEANKIYSMPRANW